MFIRSSWIFILFFYLINVCVKGDVCYRLIIGGLNECDDFENKNVFTNEVVQDLQEDEETGERYVVLGGRIAIAMTFDEGVQLSLEIVKETENGKETVFSISFDFCKSLQDDDAPHRVVMEELGIYGCPVTEDWYSFKNNGTITVDLSAFKDKLTNEFVGDYLIMVIFSKGPTDIISCHILNVSIQEYETDNQC